MYWMTLLFSSALQRLVDWCGRGIDDHHHHHAARENVVGCDLTFVMRMPHEREAGIRVLGSKAWGKGCRTHGLMSCINSEVGAAAKPQSVGQDAGIGQGCATTIRGLERLIVIGAPLIVVCRDAKPCRRNRHGVIAIRIRRAGAAVPRRVIVDVPVQAAAGPIEDSVYRYARSRGCRKD